MTLAAALKKVLKLSIPLVFAQAFLRISDIILTKMAGTLGGHTIAAFSLIYTFWLMVTGFYVGLVAAVGIQVSRSQANNDKQEILHIVGQSFWVVTLIAILPTIVLLGIGGLLALFGQPSDLIALSKPYAVAAAAAPFCFGSYMVLQQLFLTEDRSGIVLALTLFNVVMLCLVSFVFGLGRMHMGLAGFGWALTITYIVGLIVSLFCIPAYTPYSILDIITSPSRLDYTVIKSLFSIGLPLGIKQIIGVSGWEWVLAMILGSISANDLAAYQVMLALAIFCSAIPDGIGRITPIEVSRAIGQRNFLATKNYCYASIGLTAFLVGIYCIIMFVFPETLLSLIMQPDTPNKVAIFHTATVLLRITAFVLMVEYLRVVTVSVLAGFKDTKFPLWVEVITVWAFALPLGYTLQHFFQRGVIDYWSAFLIGSSLCAGTLLLRTRKQLKTMQQEVSA